MSYFFNFKSNGKFKPKSHIYFFNFKPNGKFKPKDHIFFKTLNPMINLNLNVIFFFNFKSNGDENEQKNSVMRMSKRI